MSNQNENEATTASNYLGPETTTVDGMISSLQTLRWNKPNYEYNKMFLNDVDWKELEKDRKMQKYKINANKPPVGDMYFGVDIASSPVVPKYKVVLYDKQKCKIVGVLDFTPRWIRILNNIKKFFEKLWFKIVRRKQWQANTTTNQQKTEIHQKQTKS